MIEWINYIYYFSLVDIKLFLKTPIQRPVVTILNKQNTAASFVQFTKQTNDFGVTNKNDLVQTCKKSQKPQEHQNLIIDSFETKCSQTFFMGFGSARLRQILINSITPLNIFLAFLYICLGAHPGDSRTTWRVLVYATLEELRIWGLRGRQGPALV